VGAWRQLVRRRPARVRARVGVKVNTGCDKGGCLARSVLPDAIVAEFRAPAKWSCGRVRAAGCVGRPRRFVALAAAAAARRRPISAAAFRRAPVVAADRVRWARRCRWERPLSRPALIGRRWAALAGRLAAGGDRRRPPALATS